MSFHLAAYYLSSINILTGSTAPVQGSLAPVPDSYLPTTGATGLLVRSHLKIIAAYAVSPPNTAGVPPFLTEVSGGLSYARINAPSLLRVVYPCIRPISRRLPEGSDPNVMSRVSRPIHILGPESVGIDAAVLPFNTSSNGNSGPIYALLWFCDQYVPIPNQGEPFPIRFTSTVTSTASVWSSLGPLAFDQTFPPGRYLVMGLEHWSASGVAARLIFPGSEMRPGTLSIPIGEAAGNGPIASDARTDRMFFEGGLGSYGVFDSFSLPSLEVLTNSADSVHEGYLTVIRLGDLGSKAA